MANRKEYEMLFALNAQMNGNFSSTFSKAQAEFTHLGKEVQELHRIQSDIASYQKQQTAMENTRSKLENLQQQHDLLQKEISETEGSTTSLEREKTKLEQRIKDTATALERQSQKLDATGARLEAAGVNTDNLAQKDAELTAKIKELQAEQDKAADSAASFGERTAQAFDAIAQSVITSEIIGAIGEIKDAFVECIDIAADFEEAMSTVEALSQANAQEMAALTAEAKELGATTKFTAKESADAMGYMAMAGWGAADMLQGMDGVLQLAAASGEDLAMVSDIVTDSLSAFGLTAKDTAHFSDVLAAAATNSNTNVAIMGETFKMSASVAGALGYSIEDVAVAMGLMANSGVKGSIAGTALRNTFNGLLEGVTLTGAAFGEYEYSAIKANGTMKDFGSTIDELRGYFERMTEAERVNNAMAIAGERGYNGLLAILNATNADYASLTDSINNCTGAAQRMANVKLDNMNGQLTLMNSAWDALKTTIGEQFTPEMRRLYEVGTDVLSNMTEFVQENPATVKAVAAFVGVAGTAVSAIVAANAAIKVFKALELATLFTGPLAPILAVTAGIAALTAVVVAFDDSAEQAEAMSNRLTAASQEQRWELDRLEAEYAEVVSLYGETSEQASRLRYEINDLTTEFEGNRQTVGELADAHNALMQSIVESKASYAETTASIRTQELESNALAVKLKDLARAYEGDAASAAVMRGIIDELNARCAGLDLTLEDVTGSTRAWEQTLDTYIQRAAQAEAQSEAVARSIELLREQDSLELDIESYTAQVAEARAEVERLQKLHDADNFWDIGPYSADLANARTQLANFQAKLSDSNAALAENQAEYAALASTINDYAEVQQSVASTAPELESALSSVRAEIELLTEAYQDAYDSAYESISGQMGLFEQMSVEVDTSVSDMIASLDSQVSYMATYSENLKQAAEMGLSEGLLAQLSDGSTQSAAYLQAIVTGGEEKIQELNAAFARVEEGKEEFAGTVAELQTGLLDALDAMEEDVLASVEAMSLPDEARYSAQTTIWAFVDEASEQLPAVQAAYTQLGQAAANALGLYANPSGLFEDALGLANSRLSVGSTYARLNGFASGTNNAPPGAAIVGEDGPEVVLFRGGERVIPAPETAALLGNSSGVFSPTVQMDIHIEGNATSETVEQLRACADEIVQRTLDVIEEANIDAERRAY